MQKTIFDRHNLNTLMESIEYTTVETIEHEQLLVCSVPCYWVQNGILRWPPGGIPDRKEMSIPENDWLRYECNVLRDKIGN